MINSPVLDSQKEECVYLNRQVVDDGYGGQKTIWADGAHFFVNIALNNSDETQIAEKQGTTSYYTFFLDKDIDFLRYHDVVRRVKDGKIFRMTSDGDDSETPDIAGIQARTINAEEWTLPNE